ncbi:MAG: hypothetical protein R2867_26245 [Caldilineaceae bacterium]
MTQRSGEAWLVTVGAKQVYILLEEDALVVYPTLPHATGLLQQDPGQAEPRINLYEVTTRTSDGAEIAKVQWFPKRDLLNVINDARLCAGSGKRPSCTPTFW